MLLRNGGIYANTSDEMRWEPTEMHMRIVWGKILPGQWDAFEAASKRALEIRGEAKGLKSQWLFAIRMILMRDTRSRNGKRGGHARVLGKQTAQ